MRCAIALTNVVAVTITTSLVSAHQPPERPQPIPATTAALEISPWLGLGAGATDATARSNPAFTLALDLGATLRLSDNVRVGPWLALRTSNFSTLEPIGGLRFSVSTDRTRSGLLRGVMASWTFAVDLGAGYALRDPQRFGFYDGAALAARLSFGVSAPMRLFGWYPHELDSHDPRASMYPRPERFTPDVGYLSGARVVAEARSGVGATDRPWEITLSLEVDLIGAIWLVAGQS